MSNQKQRVTTFYNFRSSLGTGFPFHILEHLATVRNSQVELSEVKESIPQLTSHRAVKKHARQSHRRIRIVQIVTTTDNQRIVGLLIPNAAVEAVLQGQVDKPLPENLVSN
ncbi:hypothetical protein FXO37_31916 [Capsicum annuum]|nr:hypothetical protein FXO37_31916 [Capsicum annuum]